MKRKSSAENNLFGHDCIYGAEGEHETPYMERWWLGRLRIHRFFRGDADPDCHDHPWGFLTFPLTSYVEEVLDKNTMETYRQLVQRFRFHWRPAEHAHRVLGRWTGAYERKTIHVPDAYVMYDGSWQPAIIVQDKPLMTFEPGDIWTIVVRTGFTGRKWGFWKVRKQEGKTVMCFSFWKDYIFKGGKHAPCE